MSKNNNKFIDNFIFNENSKNTIIIRWKESFGNKDEDDSIKNNKKLKNKNTKFEF